MAVEQTDRSSTDQSNDGRASAKASEYRFAENLPDDGGTVAEQEYEDYVLAERDSDSDEPDVLLDVPVVKVDEINFELEDLRARVSLQAEVLDLLKLNVGADVALGRVGLEIKGVEAQALLKVRRRHGPGRRPGRRAQGAASELPDITDAAEKQAKKLGVDLSSIEGTGADGRITVKDVRAAGK